MNNAECGHLFRYPFGLGRRKISNGEKQAAIISAIYGRDGLRA